MRLAYAVFAAIAMLSACGPQPREVGGIHTSRPAQQLQPGAPYAARPAVSAPTPAIPPQTRDGAPATPGAALPESVFRIALLLPLTGEGQELGNAMLQAAMLALEDQSEYLTRKNVKVVLLPKDTRTSVEDAANAAQNVAREKAQVMLGPIFSKSLEAVIPVAASYGIPVVSFSNNYALAGRGAFLMGFKPDQQVNRIIAYAREQRIQTFAALLPNDFYGQSIAAQLKKGFGAVPGPDKPLVAIEFYPSGAKDISFELRKLFGITPAVEAGQEPIRPPFQALLMPEGGRRLNDLARFMERYKLTRDALKVLGSGQWDDRSIQFDPLLHGSWFVGVNPERLGNFNAHFQQTYGYLPPRLASMAYDATAMMISVAYGTDSRSVTEEITTPSGFVGPVDGLFRLLPNGLSERGLAVLEAGAGAPRVLSPQPEYFD